MRLYPYASFQRTMARTPATKPEVRRYLLEASRQIPREDFLKIWDGVIHTVAAEADHRLPDPAGRARPPALGASGPRQAGTRPQQSLRPRA